MSQFLVRRNQRDKRTGFQVLESGKTLSTGEKEFAATFGSLSSLEADCLLVASAIFAADRATPRGDREEICRSIEVTIPVSDLERWLPLSSPIESILYQLSHDGWRITFRHGAKAGAKDVSIPHGDGRTLLFSGGLDSLAGAIVSSTQGVALQLVSHRTHNRATDTAQRALAGLLRNQGYTFAHRQFFVSSRTTETALDHDVENSQRTRSFMFLVLGALCARRAGHSDVVLLAENGQLAIHLPLTQGRIGAFSTHTAHPDVLASTENLLSTLLNHRIRITNPFVHLTKKEVIEVVVRQLPAGLPVANSCWRSARLSGRANHCGVCVPCNIRRIAIESHVADPTAYARDLWREDFAKLPADDDGRRNLADLAEFVMRLQTSSNEEIISEWPELISPHIDAPAVADMYRRFAAEARSVLGRYPNLRHLL